MNGLELFFELLHEREPWRLDANCRGEGPAIFYPERGEVFARAIRLCVTCKVKRECLESAVENEEFGRWGNTSERERRRHRLAS